MNPQLAETLRLLAGLDRKAAPRVEPVRGGFAVLDPRTPMVWDANHVRIDGPPAASSEELAADAERIMGTAGLDYAHVVITDETTGSVVTQLVAHGWTLEHHVLMVLRRPPDHDPPPGVIAREVEWSLTRRVREAELRAQPWGSDDAVRQFLDRDERLTTVIGARDFAVVDAGEVVSSCRLYIGDGGAQVDDVATLAACRGRGYARAVIGAAIAAAHAAGAVIICIIASADDWPRHLYTKLGFDTMASVHHLHHQMPITTADTAAPA